MHLSSEQNPEAVPCSKTLVHFDYQCKVAGASFAVLVWQLLWHLCEAGCILNIIAGNAHSHLHISNFIT